MIFTPTGLAGACLLEPERYEDERGYFARTWCRRELEDHGLETELSQASISFNHRRGTVRGMHYQAEPHGETKLVRCGRGALWDVIVDLRPASATRGRWYGAELTVDNGRQLYIPRGFAHGFQTLADATEVVYHLSAFYAPESARGIRWDDPTLAIAWPEPVTMISERDRALPSYDPEVHGAEVAGAGAGPAR
jgi:dTDP-4-dehydrorhamnose 3,5-epimerase